MPTTLRIFLRSYVSAGKFAGGVVSASRADVARFIAANANKGASDAIAISRRSVTQHTRVEWDRAVVLSVARGIEPDPASVVHWYISDHIDEFGGKTARQLVEEGATARLLDMLVKIRNGHRDD